MFGFHLIFLFHRMKMELYQDLLLRQSLIELTFKKGLCINRIVITFIQYQFYMWVFGNYGELGLSERVFGHVRSYQY